MPLYPGELLNKRYRIVSLLAEGQYGAVYRARDVVDNLDVAVKEYRDSSVEMQKRFRQEARRLSDMSHPQLPTVLDHFAIEETGQYLVSQYVDGVDLQSLLEQYGRLPTNRIIEWLQSACEPLNYLHEKGQLHLNIKPANIRIASDGTVFLVDSGLPGLGVPQHSQGFGAPEQQAQLDVSPASDIYSLGATLYTLLTNQVPPNALSRESGLTNLTPAREVNEDVPPYLSLVASRALSIRPDSRYETAVSFATALAKPNSQPEPLPELPRRSPERQFGNPKPPRLAPRTRRQMEQRTIIALVVLLVLVIVVGAIFTLSGLEEDDPVTQARATATLESAIVAALTSMAPTPSPLPAPTLPPTPSPVPLITDTGARMVFMPGGLFRMGTDEGEADERPSHLVRLNPFFIDETEVTNGQYAQCVAAGVCNTPVRRSATYHPAYFGDPAYDDYPVIFVTWYDADAFCDWRGGRLPSEAEWEMAAGFDPSQSIVLRFPWGDAFDGTKVNFCDTGCTRDVRDSSVDDGHRDTAPVGSFVDGRSPIGAYDMAGNVMEWVSDWYEPRYYESSTDTNPLGPAEGTFKAIRGGSWLSTAEELRIVARGSFDPSVARANLGFRCAMTPP
ncbi:SUMF1/EgtB/PvdO family nonheme iron enzyme [Candidatus Leptofilum sp.]|uniref:SUMF1/EgtB/PvdO family nonheme iron enzyme n=1 Tax=Candidatus Leptofilum sp. TaxID=3241576 RepID=UPI003B5B8F45